MGYNPQGGRGGGQSSFHDPRNSGNQNFRQPREGNNNQYPQQNQQNPNNPKIKEHQNQPIQEYCRFFQTGTCSKEGACKRIHGFTKNQSLVRTYFNRDVVTEEGTHLGVFTI